MADGSINVRHRVGLLGRFTIAAAEFLSFIGVRLPLVVIVWAINHSSFVSVNGGPWERMSLGINAKDFE